MNISVVVPIPYASITSPASGSSFWQGTNIPIQAVVGNDPNPVSQVVFYQGVQSLGTSTNSPYSITWSNVASGTYVLTAVATDSVGLSLTSNPVNIIVSAPPVTLTWDANSNSAGGHDGSGSWDLVTADWWNGSTNVVWSNATPPATTTIGATNGPAGTITLATAITVSNLTFNPAGSSNYTIAAGAGGSPLTFANTPRISVAANCSPVISAPVAGPGFTFAGPGTLSLNGTNALSGTLTISGGTLALTGNNSGSAASCSVIPGATLEVANGFTGALTLNSGSLLQLRGDVNTIFSPSSITLDSAADTYAFDAGPLTSATGNTLTLNGALTFPASANSTINVTGNSTYTLALSNLIGTTTGHNPYVEVAFNTVANGPAATIGTFQSGNYSQWLQLQGGGRVIITGNFTNVSNGSSIVYVTDGTTATLQGRSSLSSKASATADAYKYCVANGALVLDNGAALTNNTSGAGLTASYFILGAATNVFAVSGSYSAPAGVMVNTNNNWNAAVWLGDSNHPTGGITLNAKTTNNVSDGDVGFMNSGTMTIGGQNTSGTNTYANPIILGLTANKGKSVTLVAATGGEVDFAGPLLANGTDTTAGVTVGDAVHGGTVKLLGANTYTGRTTVSNGTLRVNGSLASGAVTVQSGGTLGGTGSVNGPVSIQSGGTLAPGDSIGTFTINNNLTISGNLCFRLNKSLSPSNDLVMVSGALTNAGLGVLTITNLGPALATNDTFKLFNPPLANAGKLILCPVTPGTSLRWVNNLAVNGSLSVVAVATNFVSLAPLFSGTNITLSWPADHTGWRLLAQTDSPAAGLNSATNGWFTVSGSTGTNSETITADRTKGTVFYRLVYP